MRALMVVALLSTLSAASAGSDPAEYVDPFIGTGGHGHTFPGATLPFGMVQLSPDTRLTGWDGCSGYHDTDRVVYGFSHTHLSGTGISDYGDILFMPLVGHPHWNNGAASGPDTGYASRFDKATERAEPGWYAVHLADYGIDVELSATERTGLQLYRFPAGSPAWVVVDLEHRDQLVESSLTIVGDREIEGHRRSTGWARDQVVYFMARFSRPFEKQERVGGKARLSFGDGGGELLVRVGISAVDVDGARRNLETEQGKRSFRDVRRKSRASWNAALRRIEIEGGTPGQRKIFYSALYHAMIAPNVYSDVDGRYRGMDGAVHRANGRRHYTVFSLWDTFRSTHPLYTLLEVDRTREFIQTFLAQYEQGGRLPVWELAANETDTMIGYHSVPVIVDAWIKGIRGFDGERALEAMRHSATRDHFGLSAYRKTGFVGAGDEGESVSKTLEYAYDDACIARMARSLGRDELAADYERRSQGWRHLLDPETGFMRARRNQRWVEPFDPYRVDTNYTEANAWQYSLFVPHDTEGLIEALGGDTAFIERLEGLFGADTETTGRDQADITGLIGQYAHGNEPSHHMAWLYHYAGRPDMSARRVRQILDELYTPEPDGLSGNEDCGQMSSWYVFAAMGLYPVVPCSEEYVLGVPLFEQMTLSPEGGKRFRIRTTGAGAYVRGATLDGRELTRSFLRHAEIVGGGELVLRLADEPGPAWGRAPGDRPPSSVSGPRVLAAPFLRSESDRFRDSLSVELASGEPEATIRFKTSPGDWRRYDGPIALSESTTIRFVAERDGVRSPEVEAYLHRIPNDWSVATVVDPAPQYSDGGATALVDGLRGDPDWHTGGWLGFQSTDLVATVDLKKSRSVTSVGASLLQDQGSWIFMPPEVIVYVSEDGDRFQEMGRRSTDVDPKAEGKIRRDVVVSIDEPVEARYVRVAVRNFGTLPEWHLGAGGDAWIFIDEILIGR